MKPCFCLFLIILFIFQSTSAFSQNNREDYEEYKRIANIEVQNDSLPDLIISIKSNLELAKQDNNTQKIAENSLFLSKLYYKLNSFDVAIDYNIEALKLFEQVKDTIYMIYALQNISAMYGYIRNDSASIEYSLKNLELSKQINDTTFMEGAYINLATSYIRINPEKSFEYYYKAIKFCNKTNHNKGLVFIYNNIGTYYYSKNNLDSAKYYFTKSLYSIENKESNINTATIYSNLAETDYYLRNYEEAILNSRKSIEYFKNKNMVTDASNSYQILIRTSVKLGITDSIDVYMDNYIKIQQETVSKKRVEQTAKLNILHEVYKYETEIEILTTENKLKTTKLIFISIFLMIIVLLLVYTVFQNIKLKNSYKKIVIENRKSLLFEEENKKLKNFIKKEEPQKQNLEDDPRNDLYSQVVLLMETNKPYKNPDFNINTLAKELNTNRSYISKAINTISKKTFIEFVNDYRVSEAKKLLCSKEADQLSIEGIGLKAGFQSKSTFFRVFKSTAGVTPSFFAKNINLKTD